MSSFSKTQQNKAVDQHAVIDHVSFVFSFNIFYRVRSSLVYKTGKSVANINNIITLHLSLDKQQANHIKLILYCIALLVFYSTSLSLKDTVKLIG